MPQPRVEITTLPESGPFYAGSDMTLSCMIEIDSTIDIPYLVMVDWQRSGVMLSSSERVTVSNITQLSPHMYLASVDLNPLSVSSDIRRYTCRVVVDANPRLKYIQQAIHSDTITVAVESKD